MSELLTTNRKHELPKGWVITDLASISVITSGSSAPQGEEFFKKGKYPFVRVFDLGQLNNMYISSTRDSVNDLAIKNLKLFPKGSVLFTKSGMSILLNQRAILKQNSYVVSHIGVAIPLEGVPSEWLYYFLKTIDFKKLTHATTLPSLQLSKVELIKIPLPPINEQKRIVVKIDELFSKLDKLQEIIKNCHVKITSLSQKVIDDYVSVSESESVKYQLGDISEIKGGVAVGRKIKGKTIRLPYLRVANVQDGYLDLNHIKNIDILESELDRWSLYSGDILVTEGGDRDKLGRGTVWKGNIQNCIHQNHIFRIRLDQSRFLPEYVSMILRSTAGKRYFQHKGKQSVNLASINKTQLSTFKFFCPNYNSQKSRYLLIQKFLDYLASLEKSCQLLLQLLHNLKKSILKQAFEGKLIPQNPNDESAEVLLEKIKQKNINPKINPRKKKNGT